MEGIIIKNCEEGFYYPVHEIITPAENRFSKTIILIRRQIPETTV